MSLRDTNLQLLLQAGDLSDAQLSSLIGALNLVPLRREAETDVLQFTLQLRLFIVLQTKERSHSYPILHSIKLSVLYIFFLHLLLLKHDKAKI